MPHWQALLDSAGEGIWGLDPEGKCTFVNRMALNTFGFSSEELVGNTIHDLVHHHYPDGSHLSRSGVSALRCSTKKQGFAPNDGHDVPQGRKLVCGGDIRATGRG